MKVTATLVHVILVVSIVLLSSEKCYGFSSPYIGQQQQKQRSLSTSYSFILRKRYLSAAATTEQEKQQNNNNAATFFASTTTIDINDNNQSSLLSPYQRIGITEDQLALGVSADEVLKYIGTYVHEHILKN
jgi:hypothetical protein